MKFFRVYNLKEVFKLLIFFIVLFLLLFLSKENFGSVNKSVSLFMASIIPSLFPFIFFTEMILNTNIIDLLCKYFGKLTSKVFNVSKQSTPAIIIGFLCGYPMGSKSVASLYERGHISKKEASQLLLFVNNCNPAFILSTIAIGVFSNISIGIILLISHYASAIIIGIFSSKLNTYSIVHDDVDFLNSFSKKTSSSIKNNDSFFEIIRKSILNSLVSLGGILGFIILFNLIFNLVHLALIKLGISNNIISITSGIFEITSGCSNVFNESFSITNKVYIISFLLGFSGLCILCQVYSTISKHKFSFKKIVFAKLLQGSLSFLFTYLLLKFTNIYKLDSSSVFLSIDQNISYGQFLINIKSAYLNSALLLVAFLCFFMIIKMVLHNNNGS